MTLGEAETAPDICPLVDVLPSNFLVTNPKQSQATSSSCSPTATLLPLKDHLSAVKVQGRLGYPLKIRCYPVLMSLTHAFASQ